MKRSVDDPAYREALFDVVVGKPCAVQVPAKGYLPCERLSVGVIKMSEVGWMRACGQHMDDDDEDGCIRLVSSRTTN